MRLLFDIGNGYLKFLRNDEQPQAIRSIRATLTDGVRRQQASNTSPIISYKGLTIHYGDAADNYRQQQANVSTSKTQVLIPALFTALPPSEDTDVTLICFHPNPSAVESEIHALTKGKHEYLYNDEKAFVNIKDISVLPEGYGSFLYARKLELTKPGFTLLADIGYGTVITRLYDDAGNEVQASVTEKGGSVDLATQLAADQRLIERVKTTPRRDLIMRGFANGYNYGYQANYEDIIGDYLGVWFTSILEDVQTNYDSYMPYITSILFTGGSSRMVEPLIAGDDFIKLVPDSQFASLLGLTDVDLTKAKRSKNKAKVA